MADMARLNSLRSELLLHLAVLTAAALFIGVVSIVLLYGVLDPKHAAAYMSVIVAADVFVLVGYVAYQVERVVLRPLRGAAVAAEAIAAGDMQRRLEPGETSEMENLSSSVNRMTDRLLDERAHLVRVEKMASVGRLAAGVAHEIGNPLGAINGYLHLLRNAPSDGAQREDALTGLERETSRIDRIVRGLLDYARPKPHAGVEIDLNDTVRIVVDLLTTQGALKHVDLELFASGEPCVVLGDRHELEQAFVNLLLNAVDAMEGRGKLQIILRQTARTELLAGGRRSNDMRPEAPKPAGGRALRWLQTASGEWFVMVAIADTGPGVLVEYQERIFDPFFTTKEPGKGTGLGLAIVARAVENTGGTIWVSPSREGGAAFRMLFPLAPRQARVSGSRHRPSRERAVIP
jgi:two-component system NtrC family sensor kinase